MVVKEGKRKIHGPSVLEIRPHSLHGIMYGQRVIVVVFDIALGEDIRGKANSIS